MPAPATGTFETRLCAQVSAMLYGAAAPRKARCTLVRDKGSVADAQAIYQVDDDHVLFVSPEQFPQASAEQARQMQAMRQRLGAAAQVVLDVSGQGVIDGRSFVLVPRCEPLAQGRLLGRIARWRASTELLPWLRQLATSADAPDDAAREEFLASLAALQALHALPDHIRREAERLAAALRDRQLPARHVPMHGDLWVATAMRRRDGSLAVIDWGGSTAKGYGIYDLVRAASSFGVPRRRLAREIAWHSRALGDVEGIPSLHLLGALGYYARHLGEFPLPRFIELAASCHRILQSV